MDTSQEYVKMCEKAVEVQKLWSPKTGDFLENLSDIGRYEVVVLTSRWGYKKGQVWLPRQDQLQGMIQKENRLGYFFKFIENFKQSFHEQYRHQRCNDFTETSMEQLWLAFVMKEKYEKVWDGTSWKGERQCLHT